MIRCPLTTLVGLLLQTVASAELVFTPAEIDLGNLKAGQISQRLVQVRNSSATTVTITELKASCGCLALKMTPLTLESGQSGTLAFQVNTLTAETGRQGWRIIIRYLEAGAQRQAEFVVQAAVTQEIVVEPSSLTIYGGRRTTEHTFQIVDSRSTPLVITKAETSSPNLIVAPAPKRTETPARTEVKLTIQEGFSEGRHDERMTLYTNDPEYPTLQVPVAIISRPPARFTAQPMSVAFRRESNEARPKRRVVLRDNKGEQIQVERIETECDAVTAEVEKGGGSTAMLILSCDRGKVSTVSPERRDYRLRVFLAGHPEAVTIYVHLE